MHAPTCDVTIPCVCAQTLFAEDGYEKVHLLPLPPFFLTRPLCYSKLIPINSEPYPGKDLPPVPQDEDETASNAEYYHPEAFIHQDPGDVVERSRVPLIVQAQQQQGFGRPMDVSEPGTPRLTRVLSTITERTERTEATPRWPPNQQLLYPNTPRAASSSFVSSYGEVIGKKSFLETRNHAERSPEPQQPSVHSPGPIDPNQIPVSPSGSALNRLSLFEPAPSLTTSESRSTPSPPPRPPSEPVPPSEGLPEIPDYNSKSSKQVPVPIPPPKKSKLSLLASSRASTVSSRSESSRSSGIALTGSVKTFPALRPSAHSARPPSSNLPSHLESRLGENTEYYNPASSPPSSTSFLVRHAIQTAMHQEEVDKHATSPSSRQSTNKAEPTSLRSAVSPISSTHVHPYKEVQTFRPPSKLALLALAKTNAAKTPKLPKPVTEYLVPTANGPTATTAITTSYQTLYSLTDPGRSPIIPEQYVVPLGTSPPETKQSKLAMKIKKTSQKQNAAPPTEEVITPPVSPMFYPTSSAHVRASPSAFASLLVDDPLTTSEDKTRDKDRAARHRERGKRREKAGRSPLSEGTSNGTHESSRSQRHKSDRLPMPDFSLLQGFTFDGPSPDDIVLNARRGTSLGQHKVQPPSTSTPRKPIFSSK